MKSKPRIISVAGARPQFVKLGILAPALKAEFHHIVVHTGQHFDDAMSNAFFRALKIPRPRVNLNVHGGTHGAMTGRMIARLEKTFLELRPDLVLVYGDANSTLAGALAASKLTIPVGHIEAGMRTSDIDLPEEINRRVTDHVSSLLFCPTPAAINNLKKERISRGVVLSGDLMYEALERRRARLRKRDLGASRYGLKKEKFVLATIHRADNVDNPERLQWFVDLLERAPVPILFPIHPRTRKRLVAQRLLKRIERLDHVVTDGPLGYFETLSVAQSARVVLTDSGGLQKETLFLGTPALVMRSETEWTETLKLGNRLVDHDADRIIRFIKRPPATKRISSCVGGKKPSALIVAELKRRLKAARLS